MGIILSARIPNWVELVHLPFLFEYNKTVKSEFRIFFGATLPQLSNFASELSSLEAGTVAEHSIRCDIIVGNSGIFFLVASSTTT